MSAGTENNKAVVLVSGGLDSATVLAIARAQEFECYALTVNYGQRHAHELTAAKRVTEALGAVEHKNIDLDLAQFGGSALTDSNIHVPDAPTAGIPVTYVPARNAIFLSVALGWAEIIGAHDIFIGANAIDYSGYPDCRPEFFEAFEKLANLATKVGVEDAAKFIIHRPLINMTKGQIIEIGQELGVDYGMTLSCYNPPDDGKPCGVCESCRLRAKGFDEAGLPDPALN